MSDAAGPRFLHIAALIGLRGLFWIAFYLTILLSWVAVVLIAMERPDPAIGPMAAAFWASICQTAAQSNPLALWAMWALMASAMMLPGFVPNLQTFDDLRHSGATTGAGLAALVLGYFAIWFGASAFGAALQIFLARAGMLAPTGASLSAGLTFALLAGAGLYQFSKFKDACLSKCRLPLTFFMEQWAPGARAAFRMGAKLGVNCLGCCWALMLLGFVGGTMSLWWMGGATLLMSMEKLPQFGRYLTRPMGIILIGAAPLSLIF